MVYSELVNFEAQAPADPDHHVDPDADRLSCPCFCRTSDEFFRTMLSIECT